MIEIVPSSPGRIPTPEVRRAAIPSKYLETAPIPTRRGWRYWNLPPKRYTDQGPTSRCVGHAGYHTAVCGPKVQIPPKSVTPELIYDMAQARDYWPGSERDPDPRKRYEGTSVMAGAEACRELGLFKEFHWTDKLDVAIAWVLERGPLYLGTNWYNDMFMPNREGLVRLTGGDAGGHSYICNGGNERRERWRCPNSWGLTFGDNGNFWLTTEDLATLIKRDGEVCMVVE
jgi:hypothetical protein